MYTFNVQKDLGAGYHIDIQYSISRHIFSNFLCTNN